MATALQVIQRYGFQRTVTRLKIPGGAERRFKPKGTGRPSGTEQSRTIQNLEVVDVDEDRNLILVRGSVPGPNNGLLSVRNAVKAK